MNGMIDTQSPRERELRGHGTGGNQLPMHGDSTVKLCECGCGQPAPIAKASNRRRGYVKGQPTQYVKGHHIRVQGFSKEVREAISARMTGRYVSPETGRRISEAKRGVPVNLSPESRAALAARSRAMTGKAHPNWKGDAVSYKTLHQWVARHRAKLGICVECGKEGKTDWANISGEYRRDVNDFRELCRACHKKEHLCD